MVFGIEDAEGLDLVPLLTQGAMCPLPVVTQSKRREITVTEQRGKCFREEKQNTQAQGNFVVCCRHEMTVVPYLFL